MKVTLTYEADEQFNETRTFEVELSEKQIAKLDALHHQTYGDDYARINSLRILADWLEQAVGTRRPWPAEKLTVFFGDVTND